MLETRTSSNAGGSAHAGKGCTGIDYYEWRDLWWIGGRQDTVIVRAWGAAMLRPYMIVHVVSVSARLRVNPAI